jgi:hypothetical protein
MNTASSVRMGRWERCRRREGGVGIGGGQHIDMIRRNVCENSTWRLNSNDRKETHSTAVPRPCRPGLASSNHTSGTPASDRIRPRVTAISHRPTPPTATVSASIFVHKKLEISWGSEAGSDLLTEVKGDSAICADRRHCDVSGEKGETTQLHPGKCNPTSMCDRLCVKGVSY